MLNKTARRFLGLTGTLLSGYADDLFNTLFRTDARGMIEDGYEWGFAGRERFTRDFGVIETIERITVDLTPANCPARALAVDGFKVHGLLLVPTLCNPRLLQNRTEILNRTRSSERVPCQCSGTTLTKSRGRRPCHHSRAPRHSVTQRRAA